ncbi:MAG: hypothetical protein FWC74_10000 [Candidatus Bathyarchaeota archaeon]|nr:hypothetical protein [Candidatus Termitimicrobium sp.]
MTTPTNSSTNEEKSNEDHLFFFCDPCDLYFKPSEGHIKQTTILNSGKHKIATYHQLVCPLCHQHPTEVNITIKHPPHPKETTSP